jgi:hypothetical protein
MARSRRLRHHGRVDCASGRSPTRGSGQRARTLHHCQREAQPRSCNIAWCVVRVMRAWRALRQPLSEQRERVRCCLWFGEAAACTCSHCTETADACAHARMRGHARGHAPRSPAGARLRQAAVARVALRGACVACAHAADVGAVRVRVLLLVIATMEQCSTHERTDGGACVAWAHTAALGAARRSGCAVAIDVHYRCSLSGSTAPLRSRRHLPCCRLRCE